MPYAAKTNVQKVKEARKKLGMVDSIVAQRDKERYKGRSAMYNTTRWRKLRKALLINKPLCEQCIREKRVAAATEIDHLWQHKGDLILFWKISNLQCLCKTCHDSSKSRLEIKWAQHGITYDMFIANKEYYLAW